MSKKPWLKPMITFAHCPKCGRKNTNIRTNWTTWPHQIPGTMGEVCEGPSQDEIFNQHLSESGLLVMFQNQD